MHKKGSFGFMVSVWHEVSLISSSQASSSLQLQSMAGIPLHGKTSTFSAGEWMVLFTMTL